MYRNKTNKVIANDCWEIVKSSILCTQRGGIGDTVYNKRILNLQTARSAGVQQRPPLAAHRHSNSVHPHIADIGIEAPAAAPLTRDVRWDGPSHGWTKTVRLRGFGFGPRRPHDSTRADFFQGLQDDNPSLCVCDGNAERLVSILDTERQGKGTQQNGGVGKAKIMIEGRKGGFRGYKEAKWQGKDKKWAGN